MTDISHQFGSDLSVTSGGDLQTASGADETRQRFLRRLLTNPAAYIWHLDYGAGLPAMIGTPAHLADIAAIVRQQAILEPSIAATPEPTVTVTTDGLGGTFASVTYTDADTGSSVTIS